MKERETSTASVAISRGFSSTPLAKATKHVSDLWFPVNEGLLQQIKRSLAVGVFDNDLHALIKEVSGDYSLFFFCLRELVHLLQEEEPDLVVPSNLSPAKMLAWGGLDRLKKILSSDPSDISAHSFRGTHESQAKRLQEAMISATTSERLATHYAVDPEVAYSAALLRQLGLTLIAWNYPVIYQKAIAQQAMGISLDVSFMQMFGFSPTMLAVNVVRHWHLPQGLFQSIVEDPKDLAEGEWSEEEEVAAVARTVSKICRTGEALARANNPQTYPSAANDWEFARVEIERALGPQGMRIIREKFAENCLRYVNNVPHVFTPAFVLDPEVRIAAQRKEEMYKRNPEIERCRPFLRIKLMSFYETLRPFEVSRENIQELAREIIPACGFQEGVVFTIDPATELLVPQLAIGKTTLKRFTPQKYKAGALPTTSADALDGLVVEAFVQDSPLIRYSSPLSEPQIVALAGPLGYSQRVGVIYLEMRAAMFSGDEQQQTLHFRTLMQAFNDCLHLK